MIGTAVHGAKQDLFRERACSVTHPRPLARLASVDAGS
jgi:hypothetical protein